MATQDEQIKAVADGIASLLTKAEAWDVYFRRGITRTSDFRTEWMRFEGTNAYTITITINGGACEKETLGDG